MAFKLTETKKYKKKFQKSYRKMHLKALLVFYPGIIVLIIKYSGIEMLFQNHDAIYATLGQKSEIFYDRIL